VDAMSFSDLIVGELTGGCQCGAVRYRATQRHDNAHICHCRMCQKAMGNYFAPLVAVPKESLIWTRGTPARFRSSAGVDRGFCSSCGTPLFHDNVADAHLNLTIGSLDHPELVPPVDQDGMEGQMPYFSSLHSLPDTGVTGADDPGWVSGIKASNQQHPDHDTAEWPPKQGFPA
jgi:hypothetical protein